ncbi:hypothetical protein T4D_13256 [Trichinella pseudospiralis]|uniref:Uncharacterized protein n=1 Tax=Trichinella pseudospiralis TaxID=6337 RepID=A0A0V1FGT9_TRIPS|nr:hypothetical protein T4D_13256 [Trichinella pseudospiralis]
MLTNFFCGFRYYGRTKIYNEEISKEKKLRYFGFKEIRIRSLLCLFLTVVSSLQCTASRVRQLNPFFEVHICKFVCHTFICSTSALRLMIRILIQVLFYSLPGFSFQTATHPATVFDLHFILNIMLIGLIYFATLIDTVQVRWSLFAALMLFTFAVVVVMFTLTVGLLQCSNSALLSVFFHLPRSGIV